MFSPGLCVFPAETLLRMDLANIGLSLCQFDPRHIGEIVKKKKKGKTWTILVLFGKEKKLPTGIKRDANKLLSSQ